MLVRGGAKAHFDGIVMVMSIAEGAQTDAKHNKAVKFIASVV